LNLPNILTTARVILSFVFAVLLLKVGVPSKIAALSVFVVASITDFLDGYYAKKYNLITNFGKIMDPVADKMLILIAFFIFVRMDIMPLWMFIVVFIREVLITALRLVATFKGKILAAENLGKYKTVAQIVAICVILLYVILLEAGVFLSTTGFVFCWYRVCIDLMLLVSVFLTLLSGISYLIASKFE